VGGTETADKKPFKAAQLQLEGNRYVTSSLVLPIIELIHRELARAADNTDGKKNDSVVECAKEMLANFKSRYNDVVKQPF